MFFVPYSQLQFDKSAVVEHNKVQLPLRVVVGGGHEVLPPAPIGSLQLFPTCSTDSK